MEDNYRQEMIDFIHEDCKDLLDTKSEYRLGDLPLNTQIFDGEDVFGLNYESQTPSVFNRAATMAGRALKKAALPAMAGIGLLTGAYANLIDDTQHYLTDNPIVMESVQTVPDSGHNIDTPITDGTNIVFEENGKVATVNTTDGSITRSVSQINGLDDARIDNGSTSFKMINGQTYLLLAKDSDGFLRTVESDASGSVPTWYNVSQASDGENLLRAGNNGGVVLENIASGNETTIYSNGSVSNLKIDGDLNLFVANETAGNTTLERLMLVDSNDVANATVIHNGAIKFAEMSNGSIHVGVENQQNAQTVDLYTFDQNGTQVGSPIVGLTPNTFDVDDGNMVKIENNGTVYAVDVATGNQTELTNTSVSKTDLDIEGSIATWVQNGTQVAYVTIPDVINSNATNQSSGPTLEDLMNQLNATNAQLNQTRDQLNASQANETNYLANISNLTAEITSLQGNATNNSAEIARLNGEVSNLTAEVSSYISNATNNSAEIARLNGEISNRTAEITSLQGNATNNSAEIARLNGEISNRTAEIASLEANGTNNSAEIARLNGEVSNLTAEVGVYQANETNNSAEIARLNGEVSNLTAEVGVYQSSAANDSAEINRLNGEILNKTTEILGLEANEVTYVADIARLNGDVSNLTAEISDYLTQLGAMTDQRDENATLVGSLEDQLNASEANDTAYQAEVNRLNGEISNLTAEINGLDSNASDYQTEVNRLNGEISNRTAEINAYQSTIENLSQDISNIETANEDAVDYANGMQSQRDENATRVGELEEALYDAEDDGNAKLGIGLLGGAALGAAIGANIATNRASKPRVNETLTDDADAIEEEE